MELFLKKLGNGQDNDKDKENDIENDKRVCNQTCLDANMFDCKHIMPEMCYRKAEQQLNITNI